jgi:hypothetical protein
MQMSATWKSNIDPWWVIAIIATTAFIGATALPVLAQTSTEQTSTQEQTSVDSSQPEGSTLLEEEELEVLVARIALYPDDLVALVTSASLYPVDIVDAARYLEKAKTDKALKPRETWDGSVISLLNYPEIVVMMSDDLDWTQSLGGAIADQQEDVLDAIQQLRDEAVAKNIIATNDKIKVVQEDDSVVIQSASAESIYVPKYEPEMLYEPDYVTRPVDYYPNPYPYYYYPTARYFAGFVTGAVWGATVDWRHRGVWGGRWNGNDVNINCHKCFNNIDGKVRWNDVDWRHVDRSKISFDHDQLKNVNRKDFNDRMRKNVRNDVGNRANSVRHNGNNTVSSHKNRVTSSDIRASKNSSNRKNSNNKVKINNNINVDNSKNENRKISANDNKRVNNKQANVAGNKKNTNINRSKQNNSKNNVANVNRNKANVNRNARRPGETRDHGHKSSAFGDIQNGHKSQMHSTRGRQSLGNHHGGGTHRMRRR